MVQSSFKRRAFPLDMPLALSEKPDSNGFQSKKQAVGGSIYVKMGIGRVALKKCRISILVEYFAGKKSHQLRRKS